MHSCYVRTYLQCLRSSYKVGCSSRIVVDVCCFPIVECNLCVNYPLTPESIDSFWSANMSDVLSRVLLLKRWKPDKIREQHSKSVYLVITLVVNY
jgi:hypothetical protein